jgi:dUTP pyrophosphatase
MTHSLGIASQILPPKMELLVKKLIESAQTPTKAHESDAGYDLYASERQIVLPGDLALVKTGIAITLPEVEPPFGVYARIAPRSGFSVKTNSSIGAGVVDHGYSGELRVLIMNHGTSEIVVEKGDRIAQLIIEVMLKTTIKEVDALESTSRGAAGFGSTGR